MGKSTSSRSSKNDEKSTLLNSKGWQKHWVNHTPFTVFIFTFAVACFAGALLAATTLVSGGAKEVQEYFPPVQTSLKSKAYGATHAGVGFANYVVGNAVSNFWNTEMGKKGPSKMTDPFASFLLKPKKGKKAALQGGADEDDGESPEQHADEAQPVDPVRRRIGTARATPEAIRHAQDVAASHVRRSRASASTSQDNIVMARQPPAPLAFRAKY